MANQMIALQSRNPQLPDPARATAQYANMMNMASQQRASQLQSERIRQEMDYATAEEARAAQTQAANMREKDLDIEDKEMLRLYKIGAALLETEDPNAREAGYQNLLGMIDKTSPQLGATMRQVAGTFSAPVLEAVMMETEQYFNKKYPNAQATLEYTAKGQKDEQGNLIPEDTPVQVTTGRNASTKVIRSTPNAASPAPVAAPRTPTGSVPTGKFGATLVTPDSARPLTPYQQDHIRQMQEGLGMSNTPASFSPGASAGQMTPQRAQQVVDTAVKTGMMAQADFDQLMALAPEQNKQPFMEMIRANNIKLQPGGMGQQPQFADLRGQRGQLQTAGLRGAPPMDQTLAQYIAVKRKDPDMGAYPGSARVPIERVRAEAQAGRSSPAEEAAKKRAATQVEIEMAPELAKATKNAERAVELRSTATKAKYATEGILSEVADRINTIDQLLRNPNRFSIVGAIEGNLPRLLQTGARADAQAAFDKIKNTATLTSLIDMRRSTETGASPVGANPTDKDAKIVEQAASKLIQTGEPATFDAELIDMRRKLYRTYQNAQREYDGVYGDVIKENPKLRLAVPKVSDRYLSTKDLPKQKTPVKTPTSRLSAETRAKYGL
jgi:hypothetical protein